MTQEEKQLLLKDLCARLPYGVKCYAYQYKIDGNHCEVCGTFTGIKDEYFYLSDRLPVNGGKTYDERYSDVKPYLRPMSSMTDEEDEEWEHVIDLELQALASGGGHNTVNAAPAAFEIDFYNIHHFDYRGLIEKGLALEAPEGMYKID